MRNWPEIQPDRQCADSHDCRDEYQDLNQHASDASRHRYRPFRSFLFFNRRPHEQVADGNDAARYRADKPARVSVG